MPPELPHSSLTALSARSTRTRGRSRGKARQTKSGRSRSIPIHSNLRFTREELPQRASGVSAHFGRPQQPSVYTGGIAAVAGWAGFPCPRQGRLKPYTVRHILIRDVLERFSSSYSGSLSFAEASKGLRRFCEAERAATASRNAL